MAELEAQLAALGRGERFPSRAPCRSAGEQPHPADWRRQEEGFTSEEMKLQNEGRKIMHLPELRVNCTCVRVPVLRSHLESITLEFERDITVEEARAALSAAPGVKLVDDMSAEDAHDRFPHADGHPDQDPNLGRSRAARHLEPRGCTRHHFLVLRRPNPVRARQPTAVQIAKLLCE